MKNRKPRALRAVPDLDAHEDFSDVNVRAAMIVRFGPQCAGWLCNRMRRHVRRRGSFDLHIPLREQLPPYADIALSYLEKHAKRWKVVRTEYEGIRHYRVYYLPKCSAPLPASIAKVLS